MNSAIVANRLAKEDSLLMKWKKDFVLPPFKLKNELFCLLGSSQLSKLVHITKFWELSPSSLVIVDGTKMTFSKNSFPANIVIS